MEGTPYWRERTPVMSSSVMKPILVRQLPSLPPLLRWNSSACCELVRSDQGLFDQDFAEPDRHPRTPERTYPSLTLAEAGEEHSP